MTSEEQAQLVANLCTAIGRSHGGRSVEVLQTHISFIVLTGECAYKIKKTVKLGFLDYSTLEKRHFYCQEELRLNRRCAPLLYLDVVAIGGTAASPVLDGGGAAIEYAVKMREFPQECMLVHMLEHNALSASQVDALANALAAFHRSCDQAAVDSDYGVGKNILRWALDNFSEIRGLHGERPDAVDLDSLQQWTTGEYKTRADIFVQRKMDGWVREGHGDLHLGNVAQIDDVPVFFDCIEFNADLRWIDVMNEAAFLMMDFQAHGRSDFAYRFLNTYLEATGDYGGLGVLRFYTVYRLVVRAKIALLRQPPGEQHCVPTEYRRYMDLTTGWTRPARACLVLMHGFSGSGKTALSQVLLQDMGAVRLRSDVERKRMAGIPTLASSQSPVNDGLYASDKTQATYLRLLTLAQAILAEGYTVIVDAAFLRTAQRRMFSTWAGDHHVPLLIVDVTAPHAVLRERVASRLQQGLDASEAGVAVLQRQLQDHEPFEPDERSAVVEYDATQPIDSAQAKAQQHALKERLNQFAVCNTERTSF